jgi:UDP-N-acetylmuramoyl-tripeptide--D-alanyl-D-alanine ligase
VSSALPENSAAFTLEELLWATGAELSSGAFSECSGIGTDTRADLEGKLFVAVAGPRFDGHAFVDRAAGGGAAAVLVEKPVGPLGATAVLRVSSTLSALRRLARAHRRRWNGTVVAVAGSAGKTTTKSAIAAALEVTAPGAVHAVPGNLNNEIGVPLVLLSIEPRHRFAVVEIGTNRRGEVAMLAGAAEPDVGVLTLVGWEHAEGIGSLDDIEAEEGDLLATLPANGVAVGNGDDPRVLRQLERSPAPRRIVYGCGPDADYRLVDVRSAGVRAIDVTIETLGGDRLEVRAPLVGLPGGLAVCAAIAVAEALGAPISGARLGHAFSERLRAEPGRLTPLELAGGGLVLDDSYNSNPASLASSLAVARDLARSRGAALVLVLGEMRELGDVAVEQHRLAGKDVAASGARELIGVGGAAAELASSARERGLRVVFVESAEQAVPLVLDRVSGDEVVLVKASRGVGLERVVSALAGARGAGEQS